MTLEVQSTKDDVPLFEDYLNSAFPCDDLFFNADKAEIKDEPLLLRSYSQDNGLASSPECSHSTNSSKDDSANEADSDISLAIQATQEQSIGKEPERAQKASETVEQVMDPRDIPKRTSQGSLPSGDHANLIQRFDRSPVNATVLPSYQLNLQGIPSKSRVETQIRLGLQLVRIAKPGNDSVEEQIGDRFQWLKLPSWAMAKEKLKIQNRRDAPATIDPNRIIFLDARVVKSTEPLEDVTICAGCVTRERKRAQRKKDPPKRTSVSNGSDPSGKSDVSELVPLPDEEKKILVFNCPELLEVANGEVIIPTRVTCYCRHHKEKDGFRIIITLRDAANNILASTSSELVLITDDHKTTGKVQRLKEQVTNSVKGQPFAMHSRQGSESHANEGQLPPGHRMSDPTLSNNNGASVVSSLAPSRRSSISSVTASRKRKVDHNATNVPHNNANKMQRVPGSLSMTNMGQHDPRGIAPSSALHSQAASPTNSSQYFKRSPSQDSLFQFMNEGPPHNKRLPHRSPPIATSMANSIASPDNCFFDTSMDDIMQDRNLSLSPRTRTWDYIMDNANIQEPNARPSSGIIMPPTNQRHPATDAPMISRMIPAEGPLQGGIEVTVLGTGFYPGITAMFGDSPAVPTHCWSPTTLVCVLPPATNAGPVAVTFKEHPYSMGAKMFTYKDETDRALYELALQVIGLKTTGRLETARDVAMRICSSRMPSETVDANMGSIPMQQLRASLGITSNESDPETLIRRCLRYLDEIDNHRAVRISHRSKSGHTLLHLATIQGYYKLVLDLLERGANANTRDRASYTALHIAALHGRLDIAKILLTFGHANLTSCTSDGRMAYDLAADTDNLDLMDALDPWADSATDTWIQPSARTTRSNSIVSARSDSDSSSLSFSTRSISALSLSELPETMREARASSISSRTEGIRTLPNSRDGSPSRSLNAMTSLRLRRRTRSFNGSDCVHTFTRHSHNMPDLSERQITAKEAEAIEPDAHTIAAHVAQLQQSWMAFLAETSPVWLQRTFANANASFPEVLKSTSNFSHHMQLPSLPISAFQAMLPQLPHLRQFTKSTPEVATDQLGTVASAAGPDASWLQSIVTSLGAPPSYAEATSIVEQFNGTFRAADQSAEQSSNAARPATALAEESSVGQSSGRAGTSWTSIIRNQGRLAEMTPEQQRAQVRRLQKPADRMMFFFWLPCLMFFIMVSLSKAFFSKLVELVF